MGLFKGFKFGSIPWAFGFGGVFLWGVAPLGGAESAGLCSLSFSHLVSSSSSVREVSPPVRANGGEALRPSSGDMLTKDIERRLPHEYRRYLTSGSSPDAAALAKAMDEGERAFIEGDPARFKRASFIASGLAKKILAEQGIETKISQMKRAKIFDFYFLQVVSSAGKSQYAKTLKKTMENKLGLQYIFDPMATPVKGVFGNYQREAETGGKYIVISGVDLLGGDWTQASGILVHELSHAAFANMRERGIYSPFHGRLFMKEGASTGVKGYEKYFNFEELHNWKAQVQNQLKEMDPRANVSGAQIVRTRVGRELDTVEKFAEAMAKNSKEALKKIAVDPSSVTFEIDPVSSQILARVQTISGDASLALVLVNLQQASRAEQLLALRRQLVEAAQVATQEIAWAKIFREKLAQPSK